MVADPKRAPTIRTLSADADVVRNLRIARGLSRSRLVAIAGELHRSEPNRWTTLSLSTLRRIEAGEPVMIDVLHTVARLLETNVLEILSPSSRAHLRGIGPPERENRPPPSAGTSRQAPVPAPHRSRPGTAQRTGSPLLALRVRLHCETRFQTIMVDYYERARRGGIEEVRFWRLYWSHQMDQFQYWKDGLLDEATYRRWLEARTHDHSVNWKVKETDYREGWTQFRDWTPHKDFVELMELVFTGDIDAAILGAA